MSDPWSDYAKSIEDERQWRAQAMKAIADVEHLTAERDAAVALVQRVRWLADGFDPEDGTGYAHYAVAVDDEVILAVGLDDLRAALDGEPQP